MRKSRLRRQLALASFLVAVGAIALATAGFGESAAKPANRGGRIVLTMGARQIATFQDLSSLTLQTVPPGSYKYADRSQVVHKLPARLVPPTIVLQRGTDSTGEIWQWHQAVRQGNLSSARRNVTLTVYNGDGQAVAKYWLESAWPMKLDISAIKAGASEVMYETTTLVCEYIQRVTP